MKESRALTRARTFVGFLETWRYGVLLLVAVLTFGSLFLMRDLRFDNSDESFFTDDDPAVVAIERFRELFGNEDFVYVAVRNGGDIFDRDTLRLLDSLALALEKDVPHIREVKWLGSAEYIRAHGDEVIVGPGLEEIPDDPEAIRAFKKEALALDDFVNVLISPDATIATIVLECERYPDGADDPRKDIAPAVYRVLQRPEFASLETHLAGPPVQDYESDKITRKETVKLTLVCLMLQALLLFRMGNGIRAVIAPVAVICISIILTMGIISLAGWTVSMMDIMLPTMLFSVCIGDTVHIIAGYHLHRSQGTVHHEAMVETMREVFIPCLFTSLTTMMGFLSFLTTDIIPIRIAGIYSAIGVAIAFVLAITLTPIAYMIRPEQEATIRRGVHDRLLCRLDAALQGLARWSIDHARLVIVFFLVTSLAGACLYQRVVVETNTVKDISTSEKLRRDSDFFDTFMGGSMSLEIMVDSGKANGARELRFLQDMELLQRHAESLPGTVKTHSIVDIIKRINEVLHGDDGAFHRLPDSQELAGQYLFFYETSGGKNLDRELSLLSDVARIHIQTRNMGTQEVRAFMQEMDTFVRDRLGGRLRVEYTGQMAWLTAVADYVGSGQAASLASAVITIGLMMILCLRSVVLGCISMLPNIVPILMPMGLMGLAGIDLSLVLMIFSSVIIGVCVDDTTHFYVTFQRMFARKGPYRESLLATVRTVGQPVTFTTISLMLGFLVFTLSAVRTTGQFGILGAAAFFWGCLADLTLSPALLSFLKPLGKEHEPQVRA